MITRDEAFKICDTLLAHAKSAGAEDASISVNGSVEAYARFADNRVTTSGRAENLAITTTVWVDGRRGSISGNDTGADALKQMAEDAVQIARVSPVHRELRADTRPGRLSGVGRLQRVDRGRER
jgi:predicted Zn-dependent protease